MNARFMALRLPAVATAALLLGFGSPASAQSPPSGETLSLDTYQPRNSGSVSVASQPLQAGQAYTVTVSGTWSAWNAHTWSRNDRGSTVCGTPEDRPMTASANTASTKVGQDAEWLFGRPWPPPCASNHPSIPYTYKGFQIDTGSGSGPTDVEPDGGPGAGPAANHTYTYTIQGHGVPARFVLFDNTGDDNGVLTISVAPQTSVAAPSRQAPTAAAPSRSATCPPTNGFRSTHASRRAHGARLAFARFVKRSVNIDVFQTSIGRRVIGERLIARYRGLDHSLNWRGVANRPGRTTTDGYYFVRYRMTLPGGVVDTRRLTLRRVKGHFTTRPQFYRRASCGLISSYKLERNVFGGRTNRAVGIAYRLGRSARVRVTVLRGSTFVRRYPVVTQRANHTVRLRFDAEHLRVGNYRFRLTAVDAAGRSVTATLTSRRL